MKDLFLYWWPFYPNFGDALSPYIVQKLTKRPVKDYPHAPPEAFVYFCIGSILQAAHPKSIIWGSGLMYDEEVSVQPFRICAVRGPLTRDLLIRSGINCPEVYGDPALLMPRFYQPKVELKFKLGVIPHYVDKDHLWISKCKDDGCLVINVSNHIEKVIDDICSCERIISSSLHGLIVADTYGIPSLWVRFSDKVGGKGFKFRDYYASIHSSQNAPFIMMDDVSASEAIKQTEKHGINLDLDKLIEVCPFKDLQ